MAVTKTDFINYTKCPRFMALSEIKKERLEADVFYDDYNKQKNKNKYKSF